MKYILLVIAVLVLLSELNTYGQSITWQRMYDTGASDDIGRDICDDGKGNFFICGWGRGTSGFYLMKINAYGVMLWERLGHNQLNIAMAVAPSGDGGCVVTGSNDSTYAIKFDSLGNVVWWKNYSYGSFIAYDIDKTSDGGYIICGEKLSTYRDGMAFKLDSLGNLKWFKIFPASFAISLYNIIETSNNILLVGLYFVNQTSEPQAYLVKTDLSGNIIWDKKYFINGSPSIFRSINKINNGYIISGQVGGASAWFPFFIKTDYSGNISFTKLFLNERIAYNPKLKIINDNKYILSYSLISIPSLFSNGKLILTDSLGNILQQNLLLSHGYMYLENILILPIGDMITVGSNEFDTTNNRDIYVVRTDSLLYTTPIGIKYISNIVPLEAELTNVYPNPFNPETNIDFIIHQTSYIELSIYDITGKHIETLLNKKTSSGAYKIKWNSNTRSSGIYFVILKINGNIKSFKKIIYIK